MDNFDWGTASSLLGVIITAAVTFLVAWMKARTDATSVKAERMDELEGKLRELNDRIDEEIRTRRTAEAQAWRAGAALRRAVDYILSVTEWIDRGAKPPAPDAPDVTALEKALPPGH
ncbi:hypothetical protein [Corynebacterium sp. HMSC077B05]|uniref:hypothetical protein n=1 Tax=Corynebacterium sp. HMSC077B05 TaxID=1739252 RepID=UPI0008A2588A|nr:hypothetical protein [Corynebacterium sp. HMSC077B05]OFL77616.1 hypothetical protein HMPREF2748_03645 [Corynebacterium sp. HMSC077B05]